MCLEVSFCLQYPWLYLLVIGPHCPWQLLRVSVSGPGVGPVLCKGCFYVLNGWISTLKHGVPALSRLLSSVPEWQGGNLGTASSGSALEESFLLSVLVLKAIVQMNLDCLWIIGRQSWLRAGDELLSPPFLSGSWGCWRRCGGLGLESTPNYQFWVSCTTAHSSLSSGGKMPWNINVRAAFPY